MKEFFFKLTLVLEIMVTYPKLVSKLGLLNHHVCINFNVSCGNLLEHSRRWHAQIFVSDSFDFKVIN